MDILSQFFKLFENFQYLELNQIAMWIIGGLLIFLAIKKEMEPTLLLPMGLGAILVNLPINPEEAGEGINGVLNHLFNMGMTHESFELFPLLLFIGIGAMIDFGPVLSNPKLMIFGAAAQFGIFFTLCLGLLVGFDLNDAASAAIIGAADGPTSIVVAQTLNSKYMGAIMVAAYSYMALVPVVQPPIIKLCTTKKERMIRMTNSGTKPVSKLTKILFPIVVTIIVGLFAPGSVALVGFLMFGNLLRE
ncbi:MAG: sodium ion-translocating decarboxylase subunit beta, partial [Clostridia bacterium]|nr:sodium ion-translocating decarboxylase subunit beta [Clostridia bacterium]